MTSRNLGKLSVEDIIEEFVSIGIDQEEAVLMDEHSRFNRLYGKLERVEAELKSRPGDARRELMRLYGHDTLQVWLNAAKATLAIAPEEARKQLEEIHRPKSSPQSLDAGMALWTLDEGIYKPT